MKSLIYTGRVMHSRMEPSGYRWVMPYCFYGIDIDELPVLDREVRRFGYNRRQPVFLRDRDYLTGEGSFRERLSRYVDLTGVERIVLVTVPGFLARVFNPVSFYYCLRNETESAGIVAEVNNTFGDRHVYVLDAAGRFPVTCRHDKRMHVSPFNDMRGHYEFRFSSPGKAIGIHIRLVRDGRIVLNTSLRGRGEPISSESLKRVHMAHPLLPLKTVPRILWQAAILYYGRALPFYRRPVPEDPMTIRAGK